MKNPKKKFGSLLAMLVFLSANGVMGFAQVPEQPEKHTSAEIQKSAKQVYKAGIRVLRTLEYKIKKRKSNKYLKGVESTFRITRIRATIRNGSPSNEAEGVQIEYHAQLWIEELSKKSSLVYIFVAKKEYKINFDETPKLIEDNRLEDREQEIMDKLKKNLGIE
ncbi:MAG: hypothetical protein JXO51_11295 [Candidatus Aminicenantes bacterium]|nr:hypothetical protein [Candidatus Aminicenantes bacterium]